jgi:hypothetical protein
MIRGQRAIEAARAGAQLYVETPRGWEPVRSGSMLAPPASRYGVTLTEYRAFAAENPGAGTLALLLLGGAALTGTIIYFATRTSKTVSDQKGGQGPQPSPNTPPVASPGQGNRWAPVPQDPNVNYRQWTIPQGAYVLIEMTPNASTDTLAKFVSWLGQKSLNVYTSWMPGPVPDGWPGSDTKTFKAYALANVQTTVSGVSVYGVFPVATADVKPDPNAPAGDDCASAPPGCVSPTKPSV